LKHAQKRVDIAVGNKAFKNGIVLKEPSDDRKGLTRKQEALKKAQARERRLALEGTADDPKHDGAKSEEAKGAEGEKPEREVGVYGGQISFIKIIQLSINIHKAGRRV
jgi:hypothetical protein